MLGNKIKNYRTLQGLTREAFAGLTGKSMSTCVRWERGDCEPTYSDLRVIADVLNIPVSALFDEAESVQKTPSVDADIVLTCGAVTVRVPATDKGFAFAARFLTAHGDGERGESKDDTSIRQTA